jgi:MFS family permease
VNTPHSASAGEEAPAADTSSLVSGVHATPKSPTVAAPYPPASRAWYAVFVLMLMYIFSFIDRQVISLLVEPIKRDLRMSDTEIGLLQGLAFALLYTLLGVPIGRLADRVSRRSIIATGVLLWSVMATSCGLARNATQLFFARVGVGIGEAALSPAAYSMITDYFPREKLGRAFSVYNMGITIGSGTALLVGAFVVGAVTTSAGVDLPVIGHVRPWQLVFIVTGLPGLLLPLLLLSVREPLRRGLLKGSGGATTVVPFREVLRYVARNRDFYLPHFVAMGLMAMVGYGVLAWLPTALLRTYAGQVTPRSVGTMMGLFILILNSTGIFVAGRVCDRLTSRGRTDAPMLVCLFAAVIVLFTSLLPPFMPTVELMWVALAISILPFSCYNGMGPMAVNQVTPNQLRGQVSALYLFVVNIVGMGIGPVLVPAISDYVFADPAAIRYGLATVIILGCGGAALLLRYARPRFQQKLAATADWA